MNSVGLRRYEWMLAFFFAYIGMAAMVMGRPRGVVGALAGSALVLGVARIDTVAQRTWSRILRDWMSPAYILAAYWSLEPLAQGQEARLFDLQWVQWDRLLLEGYGLRRFVERGGAGLSLVLEFVYLLLYGLPSALMGWFYWRRRRDRLESFLEVLFASALLTYALIPWLPSAPPHLEFPRSDLPQYLTTLRRLNLWLQHSADITTGVFPSGHVTVAVGCWLGFRRAMPGERGGQRALLAYAMLLALATVYGRYHYTMDVAAAVVVGVCGGWLVEWRPLASLSAGFTSPASVEEP